MFLNMAHEPGNSVYLRARESGEEGKGSGKLRWEGQPATSQSLRSRISEIFHPPAGGPYA